MVKEKTVVKQGPLGWIFFTAWVEAIVYFVQQSDGFGGFVLAILKACVWPAFLVYEVLKSLAA